jgi:hypothetical protein
MSAANTAGQGVDVAAGPPKARGLPRPARWGLCGIALVLVGMGGYRVFDVLLGSNLYTVIPGRVYRGAQPTPESLQRLVRAYDIRTVVNLRGCCTPLPWYLDEGRAAQHLGLSQEDVSFSATHLPAPGELRQLVEVLDRAEYPIFLHCRHGADRTGMAAAIVLLLAGDVPYAEARRQLGLSYGHLAFGKTGQLDRFFALYEDWMDESGRPHTAANFRHWLLEEYRGGWCEGGVETVEPLGHGPRAGRPTSFRVRLQNRSRVTWHLRPTRTGGVHVLYQVWDDQGGGRFEGRAGMLDAAVGPGEDFVVTMVIPPLPAGRYRMVVDLVEEYHCLFCQVGAEPRELEFTVRE